MVAPSTVTSRRIEAGLRDIRAELDDLPEVASAWDQEPENNQVTYHLEWQNLMGGLENLHETYRAGQMAPDQQARYRELLGKLRQALPIIERLDLYRPPVPLDD